MQQPHSIGVHLQIAPVLQYLWCWFVCVLQQCVAHDSHNEGMCRSGSAGSQSALQHHETFLIRWACSFEEHSTEQGEPHSLSEITNAERKLIVIVSGRRMRCLLTRCLRHRYEKVATYYRVWRFTKPMHASFPPSLPFHSHSASRAISWTSNQVSLRGAAHVRPSAA